jgi:hypothetical protein
MTAVDWLVEQYKKVGGISISMAEIAKEMEKEQIAQSFEDGEYNYFYSKEDGKDFENGLEYYNEKFKQQEQ